MKRKITIIRSVTEELDIKSVEILIPFEEIAEHRPKIEQAVIDAGKIRFKDADYWRVVVDIDTGKIQDWPTAAGGLDLYCKPRDGGIYRLLGGDGKVIAEIDNGYVPNRCIPGDYGDYVGLKIDATGTIRNWPSPRDMNVEEFFPDQVDK